MLHLVFQLVPTNSGVFDTCGRHLKPTEGNIKNLYPKDAEFAGAAPGWQLGNLVLDEKVGTSRKIAKV